MSSSKMNWHRMVDMKLAVAQLEVANKERSKQPLQRTAKADGEGDLKKQASRMC